MLTNDQMASGMGAVRDQILAAMRDHEHNAHAGEACMGNRASAIAYLAHALGVRGRSWIRAHDLLGQYDANCPGLNCPHGVQT